MSSMRFQENSTRSRVKVEDVRRPSIGVALYEINNPRSSLTATFLTLYSLVLVMCGGILPVIDAISNNSMASHGVKGQDALNHRLYLEIFYILLYISSISSLIYLFITITHFNKKSNLPSTDSFRLQMIAMLNDKEQHQCSLMPNTIGVYSEPSSNQTDDQGVLTAVITSDENGGATCPVNSNTVNCCNKDANIAAFNCRRTGCSTTGKRKNSTLSNNSLRAHSLEKVYGNKNVRNVDTASQHTETKHGYIFNNSGVNLYLRLGAVGFGVGVMIRNSLHLGDYLSYYLSKCPFSLMPIPRLLLQMVFVFVQTFFMFKYHRIIINFHKPLVRFVMTHLTVTNICRWLKSIVVEITHDLNGLNYAHVYHDPLSNSATSNLNLNNHSSSQNKPDNNNTQLINPNFTTTVPVNLLVNNLTEAVASALTLHDRNASSSTSTTCESKSAMFTHYLFPCTIEYSLIAAAIFYKLFQNVGHISQIKPTCRNASMLNKMYKISQCHKSHKGLFTGLLFFLGTLSSVVLFYTISTNPNSAVSQHAVLVYLGLEIMLLILSILASIVAIFKLSKLGFRKLTDQESFDSNLLLIGLSGQIGYNIFLLAASIDSIPTRGVAAFLYSTRSATEIVQSLVQVILIFEASRKCASNLSHMQRKPGRALILFLLVSNLSLWTIASFVEIQTVKENPIHNNYYSNVSWVTITRIFQPLIIFYRFHSTVCLSHVWNKAYQVVEDD